VVFHFTRNPKRTYPTKEIQKVVNDQATEEEEEEEEKGQVQPGD